MNIPKSEVARLRMLRRIVARIVADKNEQWHTDLATEPLVRGCSRRAYQDAARFLAALSAGEHVDRSDGYTHAGTPEECGCADPRRNGGG